MNVTCVCIYMYIHVHTCMYVHVHCTCMCTTCILCGRSGVKLHPLAVSRLLLLLDYMLFQFSTPSPLLSEHVRVCACVSVTVCVKVYLCECVRVSVPCECV